MLVLITRCRNGQNVAWSRSTEFAVRVFSSDARGNERNRPARSIRHYSDEWQSHSEATGVTRTYGAVPSANISAIARFKTRYVPRLQRLRFLINTIIVTRFSVTIVTDMTMPAASQVAHSGNEMNPPQDSVWSSFWSASCGGTLLCHFFKMTWRSLNTLFFIQLLFFRPRLNILIFLLILGWNYFCEWRCNWRGY